MSQNRPQLDPNKDDFSTMEVAQVLGMAVRSVQLMVDREELKAWKTPGGHRRISRASIEAFMAQRGGGVPERLPTAPPASTRAASAAPQVLLIEDSTHYQKLIALLLNQQFPEIQLHTASDGIVGLTMYGQIQPQVLIVDILLPGIDGATLITSLRTQPQFARSRLIVVTSLEGDQLAPYAFALAGLPVIHKPRLVTELPALLRAALVEASPHP
jgi:excisionase family DNA binding protein